MGSKREAIVQDILVELDRAYYKHGDVPWSRHEFYAILLEEVDEVWDDIKHDVRMPDLVKEVHQVAAMCIRFLETSTHGL
jgi:hypothetical protein